jgi:hypothetical protein
LFFTIRQRAAGILCGAFSIAFPNKLWQNNDRTRFFVRLHTAFTFKPWVIHKTIVIFHVKDCRFGSGGFARPI